MLGALVYLRVMSARNWVRVRLRRLRQPKYLAGALVAAAYFYFFFFRPLGGAAGAGRHGPLADPALAAAAAPLLPEDWLPVTTAFGALALLVFLTLTWVVPRERSVLGFSEAEIAFLFPAPITRRGLVHFRLLTLQARSLLGAAVMMLFSHRWSALGGNAFTHAAGWWFIFSALGLHFSGAGFTLTRLAERGAGVWPRRLAILALVVAAVAVTLARLPAEVRSPTAAGGDGLRPFAAWLTALAGTAPLAWLLWPLTLLVGPFLAVDTAQFARALAPALAVLVLLYLWVVRSAVAFEDAAVDEAQQRAARREAWRAGRPLRSPTDGGRRAPFPLAETGWPETAFLWKNLLSTWEYFTWRLWVGAAVTIAVGLGWLAAQPEWREPMAGIGVLALFIGGYVLVAGPQFARQDLRSDLTHADVLKTYPLPGWRVVLGELLAPTVILTGICWLLLLVAVLAFRPAGPAAEWLTPGMRGLLAVAAAAVVPLLAALQLLVPNAAALIFPAWFEATRVRGGGPEAIGQRMIFFFAQFLTMLAALLPGAVVVALAVISARYVFGPWLAVPGAALGLVAVLAGELALGLWWLGRRFEKLDLSAELRS